MDIVSHPWRPLLDEEEDSNYFSFFSKQTLWMTGHWNCFVLKNTLLKKSALTFEIIFHLVFCLQSTFHEVIFAYSKAWLCLESTLICKALLSLAHPDSRALSLVNSLEAATTYTHLWQGLKQHSGLYRAKRSKIVSGGQPTLKVSLYIFGKSIFNEN